MALLLALGCLAGTPASAVTGYTADNVAGTVTDQATGLIWKRCAEGQTWIASTSNCSGTPTAYTWIDATALTGAVWRLPTVSELETIVDTTASNATINASAFPNAPTFPFWSATADANNANNGLYVSFTYGNTSSLNKTNVFLARLVSGTASTTGGGTTTGGTGNVTIVPSLQAGWNLLGNSLGPDITVASVYNDPNVIVSVWKWDSTTSNWQFYSPLATASSLGYSQLSVIKAGEGYWLNAKISTTLAAQTGAPFSLGAGNLKPGWNLVATADDISPSLLNKRLSATPPGVGVTPINFTTLWTWDNPGSNWYFYAPSLDANGTLTSYIASKGYLDFAQRGKTLGNATGFWVNSATTNLTIAPSLTLALSVGGTTVTSLSHTAATTVTAKVTDANGTAVPNVVVAFSTGDVSLATFSPATALTDAAGVATVSVNPASLTAAGASTINASSQVGTTTVSSSIAYAVTAASATSAPSLTISFSNNATLNTSTPVVVTATVKDSTGAPVRNALVIFTNSAPTLASISQSYYTFYSSNQSSFQDYTDDAGVVVGNLIPSLTAAGAGTIVASSVVGATAVTNSINYSVTAPSLTIALTSAGATTTSVSTGTPVTATATVLDAAGAAVSGAIVTFETDPKLTTIAPAATALTDATGTASVTLSPASLTAAGAGTVIAKGQVGTTPVTGTIGYSVGAAVVTISPVSFGVNPLSAFGTTSVDVTVYSNGIPVTTPQNVSFTSSCASSGKAVLSASVTTLNGNATASYRDNGCAGNDTITASVSGIASSAATLIVSPPTTGSIRYISSAPASITLKGMGGLGRQESAQIIFKVVDNGGNPIGGKTVAFTLSTQAGGITLTTATAISDAMEGPTKGQVVVGVNSGAMSTPVRVIASTSSGGSTLTTQSDELSITTGIPDQDSFSLTASKFNIEGWGYDGQTTTITARLGDHFNNPVPDGTAVNFVTEGGLVGDTNQAIKPVGSCTTVNSACSVTLTSQNPRVDGRVTVLAYAVGTESFTDLNGNGLADQPPAVPNEMIDAAGNTTDMGEAFLDYNENGVRDANEPYFDFNGNGTYDLPDGKMNTMMCDHSAAVGTTATACPVQQYTNVRDRLVVVFSGSNAVITINSGATIALPVCSTAAPAGAGASMTFPVTVVDLHGNAMPVGTTVAFSTDNGKITSSNYTVANTSGCRSGSATCPASVGTANFGDIAVTMKSDSVYTPANPASIPPTAALCNDPTSSSGYFAVTVTTPNGVNSTSSMKVTD